MAAPQTYSEWLPLLDAFRDGDDSVLPTLYEGTIDWTNVVAERWTLQVTQCLSVRLKSLSNRLQLALDRSRGDHHSISNALLMARRGLLILKSFSLLPALPNDVRNHLDAELDRWAVNTQNSLERHAEGVRHDQGRLLKTIRDQPLTAPVSQPYPTQDNPTSPEAPPVGRGRRVIF